jgi:Cu2+-exporting ATPase
MSTCFHCGEPIPKGFNVSVKINNQLQPMCCIGCEAVAKIIVANNLTNYYQFRTEPAQKSTPLVPEELQKQLLLDDESLQSEFTFSEGDTKETILTIEGISCAACAWLIEMQLANLPGLVKINVNATTQRASVIWLAEQLKLSEIINRISAIGYHAIPFKADQTEQLNNQQSKKFIKRLGISGILMMQVMMIAIGLYFGAFSGISEHNLIYLRWTSMLLTIPIVSYGAFPFYKGAINSLRLKRLSMDVPVSIAILLSFSASSWATISQQGEVYFESVAMFTFLLLIGKFLEFRARSRAAEVSANLLKLMPLTATLLKNNKEQFVAAKSLQVNDIIVIKPGETIAADGIVKTGTSQVNEAMLSGEQAPVAKNIGDKVFAGTINTDGNLTVSVSQDINHSFLNQLIRLSEQAQSHKPKIAQISDSIAQYFVAIILLTSVITAVYWYQHDPEQAFWITLSVLVATCPCALSLATPTALTCATTRLNKEGILIKAGHVMETLPKITCFAFDKTGTLTTGVFSVKSIELIAPNQSKQDVLAKMAALESFSEHPIAKAFLPYRDYAINANDVNVTSGFGIKGVINNQQYAVGKPNWLLIDEQLAKYQNAHCVLTSNNMLIAAVYLEDQLREEAPSLIKSIQASKASTVILSGDNKFNCQQIASETGINRYFAQMSAEDKLKTVKQLQQSELVAMIGDGVNDTPVFGAANISIAMGNGTDIAKSGADVILLNNNLNSLHTLQTVAHKTRKIIIENYLWAASYNAFILPLAVMGYITPYFAVIGMSASSILVVTNSLRLLKK